MKKVEAVKANVIPEQVEEDETLIDTRISAHVGKSQDKENQPSIEKSLVCYDMFLL